MHDSSEGILELFITKQTFPEKENKFVKHEIIVGTLKIVN